jgi:capsular exopolysaccharide synthesis family protein
MDNEKIESLIPDELDGNYELTFIDIIGLIKANLKYILFFVIISLLVSLSISLSTIPVYVASTELILEKKSSSEDIFNFQNESPEIIANEIEIIKSRKLAELISEGLWNSEHRNYLNIFGTREFRPKGQRLRKSIRSFLGINGDDKNISTFENEYDYERHKDNFSDNIRSRISVKNRRGTKILRISFSSPHPDEAALLSNFVAEKYKLLDRQWTMDESINLENFLEEQLILKGAELETAEYILKKYKEEHQVFALDANAESLLELSTTIDSEIKSSTAERNILINRKEFIGNKISKEDKKLASNITNSINSRLFTLRSEINDYESKLIKNISLYGETHDVVKSERRKVEELKNKLNQETTKLIDKGVSAIDPIKYRESQITDLISLDIEINTLEAKINENLEILKNYALNLKDIPEKQLNYARLLREYEVVSDIYKYMRKKFEEAQIASASIAGKVRILDRALPPKFSIKPNTKNNLILGLFLGLALSFLFVLVKEYFDSTIKSIEFIDRLKIPVLAVIPSIGQSYKKVRDRYKLSSVKMNKVSVDKLQRRLITHEDPKSPVSEAYRSLRTSLIYSSNSVKSKTILVSSPGPGEGKTTTIINLAITYANLGKKTILIDGDLRKPVLHKVFDLDNDFGLTHYLSGLKETADEVIVDSNIKNLDLISSGAIPPNPSELLGSSKFEELIIGLKEKYDVILLDAPPIMAVTDAIVMSKNIDKLILVVRSGKTDKGGLRRTLSILNQVKVLLSGIVVNAMDFSNSYYANNYYYNYYNYYSET